MTLHNTGSPFYTTASNTISLLTLHSHRLFRITDPSQPSIGIPLLGTYSSTPNFTDHWPPPQIQYSHHYKNRKCIHNPHSWSAYPSLGSFSLNSSNIVYIITCSACNTHFIRETQYNIHTRLKHLYNIGWAKLQTLLVLHFQTHSPDHLIISGLESNDPRPKCGVNRFPLDCRRISVSQFSLTIQQHTGYTIFSFFPFPFLSSLAFQPLHPTAYQNITRNSITWISRAVQLQLHQILP